MTTDTIEGALCNSRRVGNKQHLTPEQKERVKRATNLLLDEGGYTEKSLGEAIDRDQTTVSRMKNSGTTSFAAALTVCRLAKLDTSDFIVPDHQAQTNEFPNLAKVLRMGKGEWSPGTLEYGASLARSWTADMPQEFWFARLSEYDEAHRPLASEPEQDAPETKPKRSGVKRKVARSRKRGTG